MDQSQHCNKNLFVPIREALIAYQEPMRVRALKQYFKAGAGDYAEGDEFLGIRVPNTRKVLNAFKNDLCLDTIDTFMNNNWHEFRLFGCLGLVALYKKQKQPKEKKQIVLAYLKHLRADRINHWDLVDSSAYHILGDYLLHRSRDILYALAETDHLWSQRAAIVACMPFAKKGDGADIINLSIAFLHHPHDLIHKACGWILRELGQADKEQLVVFLNQYAASMPRVMLRYTIEKFSPEERQFYLNCK